MMLHGGPDITPVRGAPPASSYLMERSSLHSAPDGAHTSILCVPRSPAQSRIVTAKRSSTIDR